MKNILLLIAFTLFLIVGCKEKTEYAALVTQPTIELKFDSATTINGKHLVGVFAKSYSGSKEIFGINLRFAYDASDFDRVVELKNFKGGYGLSTLGQIQPSVGNSASKTILGFNGAYSYLNGIVQLNDTTKHIRLDTTFKRLFDVELVTKKLDVSCAPLVWEKMADGGGFLGGSNGLVITVLAEKGSKYQTSPSIAKGINRNWIFNSVVQRGKYPYGKIQCD